MQFVGCSSRSGENVYKQMQVRFYFFGYVVLHEYSLLENVLCHQVKLGCEILEKDREIGESEICNLRFAKTVI